MKFLDQNCPPYTFHTLPSQYLDWEKQSRKNEKMLLINLTELSDYDYFETQLLSLSSIELKYLYPLLFRII